MKYSLNKYFNLILICLLNIKFSFTNDIETNSSKVLSLLYLHSPGVGLSLLLMIQVLFSIATMVESTGATVNIKVRVVPRRRNTMSMYQ